MFINVLFLLFYLLLMSSSRLNAAEYSDLKDKLRSPIINARNVVIRQSLTDQFLEAFRYQVSQNEVFRKPPNMVTSQTKVVKVAALQGLK